MSDDMIPRAEARAMVAAALEQAARALDPMLRNALSLYQKAQSPMQQAIKAEKASALDLAQEEIRALASNDARAALDRLIAEARRETYEAFCAMRNDINELVGDMISSEATLASGPEMSHEAAAVVSAVRAALGRVRQQEREAEREACEYLVEEYRDRAAARVRVSRGVGKHEAADRHEGQTGAANSILAAIRARGEGE